MGRGQRNSNDARIQVTPRKRGLLRRKEDLKPFQWAEPSTHPGGVMGEIYGHSAATPAAAVPAAGRAPVTLAGANLDALRAAHRRWANDMMASDTLGLALLRAGGSLTLTEDQRLEAVQALTDTVTGFKATDQERAHAQALLAALA